MVHQSHVKIQIQHVFSRYNYFIVTSNDEHFVNINTKNELPFICIFHIDALSIFIYLKSFLQNDVVKIFMSLFQCLFQTYSYRLSFPALA